MKSQTVTAIFYAFAAALFYALNVPCSKILLHHVAPTIVHSHAHGHCVSKHVHGHLHGRRKLEQSVQGP